MGGARCENNAKNGHYSHKHQTVSWMTKNAETRIPERFPAFFQCERTTKKIFLPN